LFTYRSRVILQIELAYAFGLRDSASARPWPSSAPVAFIKKQVLHRSGYHEYQRNDGEEADETHAAHHPAHARHHHSIHLSAPAHFQRCCRLTTDASVDFSISSDQE